MKKKAIKIATSTAVVASAFVAAAPAHQADAATNVDQLVLDAQNAATVLKWAISIEGSGDGVTQPWAQYNNAKLAVAKAEAALTGLSFSDKLKYQARLADPKLQVKRAQSYIDAITSSEKIAGLTASLKAAVATNDIEKVEAAYHVATAEYRKQAILLDRVYGQSTRDQIRNAVKPALESLVASVKNEVTVNMLVKSASVNATATKYEEAAQNLTDAQAILDANVLKWETSLQKSLDDVAAAIPLQVLSVSRVDANTVTVKFSKSVGSVLPAGQFVFDKGLLVQAASVSADEKTVTLTTSTQVAGTTYSLAYQGAATGKSFSVPANAGDSSLVVDAKDTARLEVSDTRAYTVTLKNADGTNYTGAVKVDLYDASGAPLAANTDITLSSLITNVDGTTLYSAPLAEGNVTANTSAGLDGKVTFVVTGGGTTNAVYPVITRVEDGAEVEGGLTYFYTVAAADTVVPATQFATTDYLDKTNNYVVFGGVKYNFDANDTFFIEGSVKTLDQFKAALSTGDTMSVDFDSTVASNSVWNISDDITAAASISITNPSDVVTYDGVNYRLTGKGQAGSKVVIYKEDNTNAGFLLSEDDVVAQTVVDASGNWAVQAANLDQNAANTLYALQVGSGETTADAFAASKFDTSEVINVGKFTADTGGIVLDATPGAAGLSTNDTIQFTFLNSAFGHDFINGTGTIKVNDGYGKFATLTVKHTATSLAGEVTVTGITSDVGFDNTSAGITLVTVTGLKNQDQLNFNLASSLDLILN